MKIIEFVKKVNQNDRMEAKMVDGVITIYDDEEHEVLNIPCNANNLLEFSWRVRYYGYVFGKSSRDYLSSLIEEFVHTPVDERFSEKRYVLPIGKDSDGDIMYIEPDADGVVIESGEKPTKYTEEELKQYKEKYPSLAILIDEVKTEVPYED